MTIRDLVPWKQGKESSLARRPGDNPFLALQDEMNRLFDGFFSESGLAGWEGHGGFTPRVNVTENEKDLEVTAELPGMDEKDIDVTLTGDSLVIKGEKKEEKEDTKGGYRSYERSYGSFERTIQLPIEVEENGAEAGFSRGVLTIRIPKSESAGKSEKKIRVKKG